MYGDFHFKKEKLWPVLGWFLLVLLLTAVSTTIGTATYAIIHLSIVHWGDSPYMDWLGLILLFDILIGWRIIQYWFLTVFLFVESVWKVYGCWDWESLFYLGFLSKYTIKVNVNAETSPFVNEDIRDWWKACMGWHPFLYYSYTYYFFDKKKAVLFKLKWGGK